MSFCLFLSPAVSPSGSSYNETLSTLRYAAHAKNIVNKPRVNEVGPRRETQLSPLCLFVCLFTGLLCLPVDNTAAVRAYCLFSVYVVLI